VVIFGGDKVYNDVQREQTKMMAWLESSSFPATVMEGGWRLAACQTNGECGENNGYRGF
jgi:hypothetical protein